MDENFSHLFCYTMLFITIILLYLFSYMIIHNLDFLFNWVTHCIMKKWYQSSLFRFAITFLMALCIVLFVGKEFDPVTKTESFNISSDGWKKFRKGMDVA